MTWHATCRPMVCKFLMIIIIELGEQNMNDIEYIMEECVVNDMIMKTE